MRRKVFVVEVYGSDDFLIEDFVFETKVGQLAKYYDLLQRGYKRADVLKRTTWWYD